MALLPPEASSFFNKCVRTALWNALAWPVPRKLPARFQLLGLRYTRDWLPAYSFVLRARARRDTTRQDCFVVIPAHTGVKIVYCGTVVPACSSQMSVRWLSIMSRNACEPRVNKSEGDWPLIVLVLRWIALRNGSPGNCSGLCSYSSDTEENQKTVLGTSHLQLQIVKRKNLHPVQKSTWTSH